MRASSMTSMRATTSPPPGSWRPHQMSSRSSSLVTRASRVSSNVTLAAKTSAVLSTASCL